MKLKMKKSTKWISNEKKRVEGNMMRDLGHNGESQAAETPPRACGLAE